MNILIACEFSGVVRDAFRKKGHGAYSCDLLPSKSRYHIQDNVLNYIDNTWDLMIAHPPCTALCVSGNRYYAETKARIDALEFFNIFLEAGIPKICVENPVGVVSTYIRKPDQYVQPWMFGHGETKKTGLWLKNLPLLKPTNIVEGREARIHKMPPSKDRGYLRSITYQGIADAMADQWG